MLVLLGLVTLWTAVNAEVCGGIFTESSGLLQTPNFPARPIVPIRCSWLLDSSAMEEGDVQIVVYLTQLFVTSGLTFTEYAFFDPFDSSLQRNPTLLFSVSDQNAVTVRWLSTRSRFLLIRLELEQLEGNHLRVLDRLLDVYGFNLTYQMVTEPVRNDSCSVMDCSFAGNCYVSADHREFWCSCFPQFSGPSCNYGPICKADGGPCLNGGICRHAGKYPTCTCLQGYTGSRCEVALPDSVGDCNEDDGCLKQCRIDVRAGPACDCPEGQRIQSDRWRYVLSVSLANVTTLVVQHPGNTLANYLEKQIQRFFRPFSLNRFEDLQVLNISDNGLMNFHFFADRHDLIKVREGLQRIVERGKLSELILQHTDTNLYYEQGLRLDVMQTSISDIFDNDQVILSCVAQGSDQIEFSWFKDGYPVKGSGGLWMRILPKNSRNEYTAFLGIDSVKAIDTGRYTCHVADWGIQECKSLYLEIQGPPIVQVTPMAASLKKGDSIDLTCVSTNQGVSYSWTRDKNLFVLSPGSEVWEDLKPWGSILRVSNVQKSVTYTCHAQTKAATKEKSIHIDLITSGSCGEVEEEGSLWNATAAGSTAIADCSPKYIGYATRYCITIMAGEAAWEKPDFSNCISESLDHIINNFQVIRRGYMKSTLWHVLSELHSWLRSRSVYQRGEGEPILDLLTQVTEFVNRTFSSEEVINVTKVFYANVDLLLSQPNSFIHIEKVRGLQELVDHWSLMWGEHMNKQVLHLSYSEIVIDVIKLESQVQSHYYIPLLANYPRWYTANIQIDITAKAGNHDNHLTVVNYKNISKFLPEISSQILNDGRELLYEMRSNMLSVSSDGEVEIHLEMTQPVVRPVGEKWNLTCARANWIGQQWDMSSCNLLSQTAKSSHCICHKTGLFATLITKQLDDKLLVAGKDLSSPVVVLGCSSCLLQSCLTLLLLSCRRVFVQLLKLQFCLSISAIMIIFIYVTRVQLPENMDTWQTILLQLLFFMALSSLLGTLLIIYIEVVYLPNFKTANPTVFGLTSGITVLPCLISAAVGSFSRTNMKSSWWLPLGSASFYIVTTSTSFIICLFIILSLGLLRRLHLLRAVKSAKSKLIIDRRLGLMKRTSALFTTTVLLLISSVLLFNVPSAVNLYIFSSLSALLGFLTFLFYIIYSESSLNMKLIKKSKFTANDQDYCSDSDYNLFNFFTKHEPETESEGAQPHVKEEPMITLQEIPEKNITKPKLVTFSDQPYCERKVRKVDLEIYPNSPKRYSNSPNHETVSTAPNLDTGDIVNQIVVTYKEEIGTVDGIDLPVIKELSDESLSAISPSEVLNQISCDLDYLLDRQRVEPAPHTCSNSTTASLPSSAHPDKTTL